MVLAAGLTGDQFVSLKQKLNIYGSESLIRPELHITKGADSRDTITVGFSH